MRTAVLISMVVMILAVAVPRAAFADPGDVQLFSIHLHHHVSGTVGSASTGYLTVVSPTNGVTIIMIPPNMTVPSAIQPGKKVTITYRIDQQNQKVMVKIKETDSIK